MLILHCPMLSRCVKTLAPLLAPLLMVLLVVTGSVRAGGGVLVLPHTHGGADVFHLGHEHGHGPEHGHQHGEGTHEGCEVVLVCVPGEGQAPHTPPHVHVSDADGLAGRAGAESVGAVDEMGVEAAVAVPVPVLMAREMAARGCAPAVHRLHRASSLLRTTRLQV